jgi:hypothetical protein
MDAARGRNEFHSTPKGKDAAMKEKISGPIQIHSTAMENHSTTNEIHSTLIENHSAANEIHSTLNEIHSKMAEKRIFPQGPR